MMLSFVKNVVKNNRQLITYKDTKTNKGEINYDKNKK